MACWLGISKMLKKSRLGVKQQFFVAALCHDFDSAVLSGYDFSIFEAVGSHVCTVVNPPKIGNIVIVLVPIDVVNLRKIMGIWNECQSDKTMNIFVFYTVFISKLIAIISASCGFWLEVF